MPAIERERCVAEALSQRKRAENLLAELEASKRNCEQQLEQERRPDHLKSLTGKSAFDRAIADTQRAIASLDAAVARAKTRSRAESPVVVTTAR